MAQRLELGNQRPVAGGLGERQMKPLAGFGKGCRVVEQSLGFFQNLGQTGEIFRRPILGGVLDNRAFDRQLGIQYFMLGYAGQFELNGQGVGKILDISVGDSRPASGADTNFNDPHGLERPQSVADGNTANVEPGGQILLRTERVTRMQLTGEQSVPHLQDNLTSD